MTIAAGFTLENGDLLFAADTQYTYGTAMPLESNKIFTRSYDCGQSVIVITGTVPSAKMLMQHCERALATQDGTLTSAKAVRLIEHRVAAFHARHRWATGEVSDVELLIGLYIRGDGKTVFLSTIQSDVNQLFRYECFGTGAYLGHYLLRDEYKYAETAKTRTLAHLGPLVLTAIRKIKEYDSMCGRATDLVVLSHDGRLTQTQRVTGESETHYADALRALTQQLDTA